MHHYCKKGIWPWGDKPSYRLRTLGKNKQNALNTKTTMETTSRLQRDTQHKVIGGVCSGLANYFGIDVTLIRVLFAGALLVFSSGFWIYVLLWIVMPSPKVVPNSGETSQFVSSDTSNNLGDNKGSLYAGAILIGIGILGLLHLYIPAFNWRTAWPILLIVIGILLIVPSKEKKS